MELGSQICCLKPNSSLYIGSSPNPVTVTTRIIPFLVGNPNLNLDLRLLLGGRPNLFHQYQGGEGLGCCTFRSVELSMAQEMNVGTREE